MEEQPDDQAELEQSGVSKEESLAEDQRSHCEVYGVAHIAIQPGYDQVFWRRYWGWRAETLPGKAAERIQQHRKSEGDKEHSQLAKRREPEQGRRHPPAVERPGDINR